MAVNTFIFQANNIYQYHPTNQYPLRRSSTKMPSSLRLSKVFPKISTSIRLREANCFQDPCSGGYHFSRRPYSEVRPAANRWTLDLQNGPVPE